MSRFELRFHSDDGLSSAITSYSFKHTWISSSVSNTLSHFAVEIIW